MGFTDSREPTERHQPRPSPHDLHRRLTDQIAELDKDRGQQLRRQADEGRRPTRDRIRQR